MLKLSDFAGRVLREDDLDDLGRPTGEVIADAIDEGRTEEAKTLARNLIHEWKGLHDLYCDWIWDMLTRIAHRFGEAEVYAMLRATQETWMMKRTWKGFRRMSVERQVTLTTEMMRAHRCGPRQEGDVEVLEDEERYTIVMDPCGSGGRMRRGDPMDKTPLPPRPALQFRRDPGGALVELGPQGRALLLRPLRGQRDPADRVGRRAALGHRLRPRSRQAVPLALLQEARTDPGAILDPPRQGEARAIRRRVTSTTRDARRAGRVMVEMTKRCRRAAAGALFLPLALSACAATGERSGHQTVTVITAPPGAACTLKRGGATVAVARPTPARVSLDKSRQHVVVICRKSGYFNAVAVLPSRSRARPPGKLSIGAIVNIEIDILSGTTHDYADSVTVVLAPEAFSTAKERDAFFDLQRARIESETEAAAARLKEICDRKTQDCESIARTVVAARDGELRALERQREATRIGDRLH